MKNFKLASAVLPLIIAIPAFSAQAGNEITKEALQQQLSQIQSRLAQLEESKPAAKKASATSVNFYGSLRPTFGVTTTDTTDSWDVGDALSRIGVGVEHQLSNGMTGFAKGEFKVQIQGDAHFGDARLAYVGIKGDFGRVAIGKQSTTQFAIIAGPVDIFNRASTPLAYDDASPFRQQEMVTYRKSFGNVEFRLEGQFKASSDNEGSDFFNTGVNYQGNDFTVALAYLSKDMAGYNENTLGVSASKSFGDFYVGAAYQDIDRGGNGADRSTIDVVGAYTINDSYKLKLGVSKYSDDLSDAATAEITRFNTTLEWQGSPDYRLFVEYQNNNYTERNEMDSDQVIVGMRYNFDYKF